MKHLFKNGKAIIISGPQGSGKTLIALALAKACGRSYSHTTEYNMKNPFNCGNILEVRPDVVVVDEFSDLDWAKNTITNDYIKIERKGHEPERIHTPNFIFVSDSAEPFKLHANDRRFTLLEITASPLEGVEFKA